MILKNKKLQEDKSAMEMSMSVIVVAVIALLILAILIFIMGGKLNLFSKGTQCAERNGQCKVGMGGTPLCYDCGCTTPMACYPIVDGMVG